MSKLYFISSYKNALIYSNGVDVYEIQDYRWGFEPIIDSKDLQYMDDVIKLNEEQIKRANITFDINEMYNIKEVE